MPFHVGRLIDHVHLRVSDLGASKRFYRAVFAALGKADVFVEAEDHFSADELWVAAGGRDNGGPGERRYHPGYYAAFVLDPDGNNIEAVFHGSATRSAESVVITPTGP